MADPYYTLIASTVAICLLLASANVLLAARSISAGAALAFALGFSATGVTWAMGAIFPQEGPQADVSLLFTNVAGAIGMIALCCGFWLRAGYAIHWPFMLGLFALWNLPVLAMVTFDLYPGIHVPFAVFSIATGVTSSVWRLHRKVGAKNAGDWALIGWLMLALPVSMVALLIGMGSARYDPNAVWMFYLGFLPSLLTGVGLFSLLSFALEAIRDSNELARTDGLTDLLNRRAFDDELAVAVARAERYQRDLSLIVLDIDHFKRLNDRYGHPAGDAVIRTVSKVLVETSRRVDAVARIGGEEFALILPDTPAAASLRLAERIRQAVAEAGTDSIAFTASFGVSSVSDTGADGGLLLKAADEALYSAKESGRNCVRYAMDPAREPGALIGLVN